MREDLTFIAVVLDRSSSMMNVRTATISGFNNFLNEQKSHPGSGLLTLVQFSDKHQVVYDGMSLSSVPPLTMETYCPHGNTALFDAMGFTIDSVGKRLAAMPENERPGRVIMVTLTDGQENWSRGYSRGNIAEAIEHQKSRYNWKFVFLGADPTAVELACNLGVLRGDAAIYTASSVGTNSAFAGTSKGLMAYRSVNPLRAQSFNFYGSDGQIGVIPEDGIPVIPTPGSSKLVP